MAEGSLLKDPFFAPRKAEPTAPEQRPSLTQDPFFTGEQKPRTAAPAVDPVEDVKKAAIAGGSRGLAGTLVGGLGSVESFAAEDVPTALRSAGLYVGEKLGMVTPERRAEITSKPLYSGQTEEQKQGIKSPILGLPTYKGVTEYLKKEGPEFAKYQAVTDPGKVVQAGAEFAAQGVPGAVRGIVGRTVIGGLTGAGSETGRVLSGKEEDPYWQIGGALAGLGTGLAATKIAGVVGNAVRSFAAPTGIGEKQLAAAMAEDFRKGQARMSFDDLMAAQERGTPVSLFDVAGPQTRKLLERAANMSDDTKAAVARYNEFLQNRAAEAGTRVADDLGAVFKMPVNAPAVKAAVEEADKEIVDNLYKLTRAQPAAQSINHNQFGDLLQRPVFQKAMRDAEGTAANMPQFDIRPPKTTSATPAAATGLLDASGNPIMRPGTPRSVEFGNLSYWDQVQRELRNMVSMAERAGDNVAASTAINARSQLLKALNDVPGYENARGAAAEAFGAASAPEAGMKFFRNIDAMKRDEFVQNFNKFNDRQKELFALGFAQQIDDAARGGGLNGLARKLTSDAIFRDKMQMALGPERFERLQGTILSENALSKAKELAFIETSGNVGGAAKLGAVTGAAIEGAMTGQIVSPQAAVKAGAAAGTAAIAKIFLNAGERRVAEKIIPMALSTDPADIERFSRLISSSPQARAIFNKYTTGLSNLITLSGQQEPAPRASGGRVGYKAGGSVGMDHKAEALKLIARVKANHKANQKATEPLLQHDDTTVAKALAIANKGI